MYEHLHYSIQAVLPLSYVLSIPTPHPIYPHIYCTCYPWPPAPSCPPSTPTPLAPAPSSTLPVLEACNSYSVTCCTPTPPTTHLFSGYLGHFHLLGTRAPTRSSAVGSCRPGRARLDCGLKQRVLNQSYLVCSSGLCHNMLFFSYLGKPRDKSFIFV